MTFGRKITAAASQLLHKGAQGVRLFYEHLPAARTTQGFPGWLIGAGDPCDFGQLSAYPHVILHVPAADRTIWHPDQRRVMVGIN